MSNLRGIARPADAIARHVKMMYGDRKNIELEKAMNDYAGVEGLAAVLTDGINACTSKDGRLDAKDLAAYLWTVMQANQKQ
jgi:hypothetical protein